MPFFLISPYLDNISRSNKVLLNEDQLRLWIKNIFEFKIMPSNFLKKVNIDPEIRSIFNHFLIRKNRSAVLFMDCIYYPLRMHY